jgi:hypothetical protein
MLKIIWFVLVNKRRDKMTKEMRIELTVSIPEYDKIKKMLPRRRILVNGELYLKRREERLIIESNIMESGEQISMKEFKRRLRKQGIKPSDRTIKRDLDSLEARGIIKQTTFNSFKGRATYITKK